MTHLLQIVQSKRPFFSRPYFHTTSPASWRKTSSLNQQDLPAKKKTVDTKNRWFSKIGRISHDACAVLFPHIYPATKNLIPKLNPNLKSPYPWPYTHHTTLHDFISLASCNHCSSWSTSKALQYNSTAPVLGLVIEDGDSIFGDVLNGCKKNALKLTASFTPEK